MGWLLNFLSLAVQSFIKPMEAVVINYLKVAAVCPYWLKGESQIISVSTPPYYG
jgi:hypothetical protein